MPSQLWVLECLVNSRSTLEKNANKSWSPGAKLRMVLGGWRAAVCGTEPLIVRGAGLGRGPLPAWKTARLLLVCLHNHRAAPRSGREPPPRDHRQGRGVYSFREGETRPYDHTRGPRACRASQSHPFCPVGPSRGQGQRGELADFRWS